MIWTLFYYNSLPEMPVECPLFSNEVLHRDFLKCNPTNTGHYTYPKFETLSYDIGCHPREVKNFLAKTEPDKYVVFYTRHTLLTGERRNKIVGYFKVGNIIENPKGFVASESVLLPKDKCIEIDYSSRGVPVSWGNSSVKNDVENALISLINDRTADISYRYKKETRKIMSRLLTTSGRKRTTEMCEKCSGKARCYWGGKASSLREETLERLYGDQKECRKGC